MELSHSRALVAIGELGSFSKAGERMHLSPPAVFAQIRNLFEQAGAFTKAIQLVEEHRRDAEKVADSLSPLALSHLAHHLIATVLEQPTATARSRRPLAVPAR